MRRSLRAFTAMPRVLASRRGKKVLCIAEDPLGIGSDHPSGGAGAALAASSASGHPEVWARTHFKISLAETEGASLLLCRGRLIELLYVITSPSSAELEDGRAFVDAAIAAGLATFLRLLL